VIGVTCHMLAATVTVVQVLSLGGGNRRVTMVEAADIFLVGGPWKYCSLALLQELSLYWHRVACCVTCRKV